MRVVAPVEEEEEGRGVHQSLGVVRRGRRRRRGKVEELLLLVDPLEGSRYTSVTSIKKI